MATFSPTNAEDGGKPLGRKTTTVVDLKEIEINSDTESELSDNDVTPKGYKSMKQSYRPESKVIEYDDINL